MTVDPLVVVRHPFAIWQNVECNSDILHLFGDCILPKCVAISFVEDLCMVGISGQFDAILLSGFDEPFLAKLHLRDDPVAFL